MPKVKETSGLDFYLMQARVRALLDDKPAQTIAYFEDQLNKSHSEAQSSALRYGLAIVLQRRGDFDRASGILQNLLKGDPTRLSYQLQIADLDLERKDDESALQRLGSLYHNFPGNHAIAMQYSKALLTRENPQRAETASIILRQQILFHEEDPVLFALYAKSANIAGDKVRAGEAIAESYYLRGGIREAIEQLEMLSRDHELDYYQRARISARLLELRIQMVDMRDGERGE